MVTDLKILDIQGECEVGGGRSVFSNPLLLGSICMMVTK